MSKTKATTKYRNPKAEKKDEIVVKKYLTGKHSMREIGDKLGVSSGVVRFRMVRFVERNPRNELSRRLTKQMNW